MFAVAERALHGFHIDVNKVALLLRGRDFNRLRIPVLILVNRRVPELRKDIFYDMKTIPDEADRPNQHENRDNPAKRQKPMQNYRALPAIRSALSENRRKLQNTDPRKKHGRSNGKQKNENLIEIAGIGAAHRHLQLKQYGGHVHGAEANLQPYGGYYQPCGNQHQNSRCNIFPCKILFNTTHELLSTPAPHRFSFLSMPSSAVSPFETQETSAAAPVSLLFFSQRPTGRFLKVIE